MPTRGFDTGYAVLRQPWKYREIIAAPVFIVDRLLSNIAMNSDGTIHSRDGKMIGIRESRRRVKPNRDNDLVGKKSCVVSYQILHPDHVPPMLRY